MDSIYFRQNQRLSYLARGGFRSGSRGTHSSRTLMLTELEAVLAAVPGAKNRAAYSAAIIEANCLEKPTISTRRSTNQRLGELFSLDPSCALFRVLRRLWAVDAAARPLLAMLAALARDPLFMASATPVLATPVGTELQRSLVRQALREVVGERMNDAVLEKVVRNVSSSWTQTGHLRGRTFKIRQQVRAGATSLAFAVYLGHAAGLRGEELLTSGWIAALDCKGSSARALALDAKRIGLINFQSAGDAIEFGIDRLVAGT